MLPRTAFLGCVTLLLASTASATTHLVLPNGSGDFPKIQDAIDAAVSGDEIVLGDGTFLGARNRDLVFLGKNLTLRSQSGDPALCTIDCQSQTRGINITQGETAAVVEGITIRNGYSPGTLTIPPSPGSGGGVYLSGVTVTLRNCVITQCTANDASGSAIAAGMYASGSTLTLEDCAFVENFFAQRGSGAGLFAWGNSAVTATRCRFVANRAPGTTVGGSGGGIRVQDSRLTLLDCEVVGNTAITGAGISCGQLCLVDFRNSLVAGNVATPSTQGTSIGGGIQFGYDTDGSVTSCTIVGNRASNRGGGITVANDGQLTIERTIIWGNCSPPGTGESAYSLSDGTVDFVCSDVDPASVLGGTVTYTNSVAVDPLFCGPQACASAPTTAGTYTLDASSPLLAASGCGLIGRSPQGCGAAGIPVGPAARDLGIRCAPNPFRGTAALSYSIAEPGRVEVALFDAAGRQVVRFDEGLRQPGVHTIQWNGRSQAGSRVPAGAYFVRVSSQGRDAGEWIVRLD